MTKRAARENRCGVSAAAALLATPLSGAPARYQVGITTNTRGGWEKDVFLSFREAREAVNIPVLGLCETSLHVACMMGANFSLVTIGIVIVSLLPVAFEYISHRRRGGL